MRRFPRVLRVPQPEPPGPSWPPHDDERHGPAPATEGALALAFDVPPASRPEPVAPPPAWLRSLAQAVAEVLAGRRPPETVTGRFTRRARARLLRAVRSIDPKRIPMVGTPRVCRPGPDVIEASVVINSGSRAYGLALRLERQGVQWVCTDLAAPVLAAPVSGAPRGTGDAASCSGGRRGSA